MRPARAFGGGKVILLGEHAVVHGAPALAAGIGRGVHARAERADRARLVVTPWDLSLAPDDDHDLARALGAVLRAHPLAPLPPLRVDAEVELPPGAGLGCSAALGVAVLRAVDAAVGLEPASDAAIAERALVWERVFHGNPSGVDNAMAASGGVALFRRGEGLSPLRLRAPLTLVIGDSGEPSSTRQMVEGVAREKARDAARFDKTLAGITALVNNARHAVEHGDVDGLGQLMNLNQALLSSWMVSTPILEELCEVARDAGALGAKLTGGGGGGCMIALSRPERAPDVRRALEATGHAAFVAEVGR